MKTLRMIGMALLAVLMCVNFASCSSEEDVEPNEPQKPKEYTVSLGFTGEISVSESPLSRASENDLYGIQVYSCPNNGTSTTYSYYAYGLFDDTSLINIKLLEGYKYKFVATMVVDGKNQLGFGNSMSHSGIAPFYMSITNYFKISHDDYMSGIDCGESSMGGYKKYYRPKLDRYYGITEDYVPTENGNVSIFMKRTAFGAKFIAENLEEGTVSINLSNAPEMKIVYSETETMGIFTFSDVAKAYSEDNYSEIVATEIIWTKADGVIVPLGTHRITFKRNVLTTVTIKVADITTENGIGITFESGEMGTEGVTIENGKIVDTNVNTGTEE